MPTPKKVHVYCRVSTEDQSLQQQMDAIRGHYPEGTQFEFFRESLSGWTGKRPEYELLKKLVVRGSVKEVASVNLARLGRRQREFLSFLYACQDRGCKLNILDSPIDLNSPMAVGIYGLLAAFAELDSDLKSANIKRKFDLKRKQNPDWMMHGSPPDCVARKVKDKSEVIYQLSDAGMAARQIARNLELSERAVGKVLHRRGMELLTREEYGRRFPGWHLLPRDRQPRLIDGVWAYPDPSDDPANS